MKRKRIILYILMLLPLAAVLTALPFLPAQIPAHYDFNGQVTRWGSKYETLLLPAIAVLFGLFMLGMARFCAKREEHGQNNEKVCLITGSAALLLFNVITGYFLYTSFQAAESLSLVEVEINQLVFGALGLTMIVIGNIMPKLRMNAWIGLRTTGSMKNEITWKKSQRFGGISLIAGGIIIAALCFFVKGMACFWAAMGVLLLVSIVDIWYTYRIAKLN